MGQRQQEGELRGGRETLWEDKATAEGLEALLGDGMQHSSRPGVISWFYLLTK